MHKKTRNSREKTWAMESHFYSMDFFFSFTRIFLYTFRNIPYHLLMLRSYFQNNECKNISKFERKNKSNGIPLVQHGFFFSFTRIFLGTFRNIAYNFLLCCVRISRIMNVKKNSKFEREDKVNGIPLLHHSFSFTRIFLWTFRGKTRYSTTCDVWNEKASVPWKERTT